MRICLLGFVDECKIWRDGGNGAKTSDDAALQKDTSIQSHELLDIRACNKNLNDKSYKQY